MPLVPILFASKTTAADRTSCDDPFSLDPRDPFGTMVSISSTSPKLHNVQIDWKETPTSHVFKADLPGLNKGEVQVEVEEQRLLKIHGERAREAEEEDHTRHRGWRSFGKFLSSIPLPEDATVDDAKAVLENGVLTVTVPRDKDKKAQARVIQIEG